MYSLAHTQNKGVRTTEQRSERITKESWLDMIQPLARRRQRGEMASSTKLWAGFQLLTTSSWDPGWLTSARKVTAWDQLPRGGTWHAWEGALVVHLGNQAAGTREVIKMNGPPETVHSQSTLSPELLRPGKGTKRRPNWVCTFVEYLRTWTWAA